MLARIIYFLCALTWRFSVIPPAEDGAAEESSTNVTKARLATAADDNCMALIFDKDRRMRANLLERNCDLGADDDRIMV